MQSHFNQPRRQSPVGVLVMFLDTMRHYAKALWPVLVIWVFKFDEINKTYLFLGVAAVFILIGIIAYLRYQNFTFHLDYENDEFVINEGIFNKTKTAIQLDKIQQVNINQSLLQKIIGVYALDVDTAGSNNKEGEIKAISHPLAVELKARLLDNSKRIKVASNHSLTETVLESEETSPFIKISLPSLLKVGITSNYIKSFSLLLIFFFTVSENINKLTGRDVFEKKNINNIDNYVNQNALITVFVIGLTSLFCIVLIINLVRIVFRYFDYKITKQKGSLLLSYGLLNTKNTIIKPEKVQITAVSRNYFQKKMNILEIKIKQATSGSKEERKSAIDIPGCNDLERDEILKLLFHKIPEKGVMLTPNFRKLGFALFLTIGLPLIGFYFFRKYNPEVGMAINYLIPVYIVFVGTVQFFKFRNYRLFIHDDFIIKQSGAWDISNEIIEPSKIQAITTSQLFWHKSIGIGSLTLHTAGGNIAFQLGNFNTIKQYANLWLYEMETSDSNWM
jgi:putative membrane protein